MESTTAASVEASTRLNVVLSKKAYADLNQLATQNRMSMTDVIRTGIGLLKLALDARRKGQKLVLADEQGKAISELILPE